MSINLQRIAKLESQTEELESYAGELETTLEGLKEAINERIDGPLTEWKVLEKKVGNLSVDVEDLEELVRESGSDAHFIDYARDVFKKHWGEIEKLKTVLKDVGEQLDKHVMEPAAHDPYFVAQKRKGAKK